MLSLNTRNHEIAWKHTILLIMLIESHQIGNWSVRQVLGTSNTTNLTTSANLLQNCWYVSNCIGIDRSQVAFVSFGRTPSVAGRILRGHLPRPQRHLLLGGQHHSRHEPLLARRANDRQRRISLLHLPRETGRLAAQRLVCQERLHVSSQLRQRVLVICHQRSGSAGLISVDLIAYNRWHKILNIDYDKKSSY